MIGDSVSREYRKPLAVLTGRPVDSFAASTPIVEEIFFKQLELFFEFKEYRQQKAHIQINSYGIDGVAGSKCDILLEDYKKAYERMVQTVMKYIPEVIISTYTHIVYNNNVAVVDQKVTDEIKRRNAIAVEIAGKYNLKTNDLYTAMLHFPRRDHVHFEKRDRRNGKICRKSNGFNLGGQNEKSFNHRCKRSGRFLPRRISLGKGL